MNEPTFASLDLPDLTNSLSPFGDFLLLIVIISMMTMAFLQVLKALQFKRLMHQHLMRRWFKQAVKHADKVMSPDPKEEKDEDSAYLAALRAQGPEVDAYLSGLREDLDAEALLKQLTGMAFPSSSSSMFYKLQLEQMIGQINAAVQPIIDTPPQRHQALLFALSHKAGIAPFLIAYGPDVCRTEQAVSLIQSHRGEAFDLASHTADAINRVNASVQRSLDSMQIFIGMRWRGLLAYTSGIIGIAIAYGFALLFDTSSALDFSDLSTVTGKAIWVIIGLTATVLAPIFRDVAVAIRRLARPNE